jgi:hypothetical protein
MTYRLGDSRAIRRKPLNGLDSDAPCVKDSEAVSPEFGPAPDPFQWASWTENQPRSGCYALWEKGELQYIGASKSLNSRIYIHHCSLRYGNHWGGYKQRIPYDAVTYYACPAGEDMRDIERELIARHKPPYNTQGAA